MTTVILRLFFYGLVAFAPDEFKCGENMRALLIDARNPPVGSDGCQLHSHHPALFYGVQQQASCKDPCRYDRGLCRCDLVGGRFLDIGEDEGDFCWMRSCKREPDGAKNCSDRGFNSIPKLEPLRVIGSRMKLRDDCNNACPVEGRCRGSMCRLIAAQINFYPRAFSVCRMAGQSRNNPGECREFDFKPITGVNLWPIKKMQMAEIVQFQANIKVLDPRKVALRIVSFDGAREDDIVVPVTYDGEKYFADIVVANFMEDAHHGGAYGRCDQDLLARDFELYHDLARQPMYPSDRPVPLADEGSPPKAISPLKQSGYASCGDSKVMKMFQKSILRAGDSRPICPQAAVEAVIE